MFWYSPWLAVPRLLMIPASPSRVAGVDPKLGSFSDLQKISLFAALWTSLCNTGVAHSIRAMKTRRDPHFYKNGNVHVFRNLKKIFLKGVVSVICTSKMSAGTAWDHGLTTAMQRRWIYVEKRKSPDQGSRKSSTRSGLTTREVSGQDASVPKTGEATQESPRVFLKNLEEKKRKISYTSRLGDELKLRKYSVLWIYLYELLRFHDSWLLPSLICRGFWMKNFNVQWVLSLEPSRTVWAVSHLAGDLRTPRLSPSKANENFSFGIEKWQLRPAPTFACAYTLTGDCSGPS